ncbi:ribosyldihydronicotinamide dehydrogenase [quinone]-like [Sphaeramia orbicularis]|uniref:ribosyldihydronicotinamide dehydrogenase [quinone]-like n=1 Tax=Sphaeramia orbicularis TaxID=375764 RepID=UPI00117CC797|nr:ribosyldihydronicotinamide dehydrogenase [quinone]-like [Sphaeramia orbicularis]
MAGKRVLIVYAHQDPHSFNAAAKEVAVEALTSQGFIVEVSDLYAMNFKATATAEDITGELAADMPFHYAEETKLAWQQGKLSADITEEQRKLTEAELVIFQFPIYWFSAPAILKGWFDRVLTEGFAFTPEKRYSQGIFQDKKAILSFTTGSQESMFGINGINGDVYVAIWPIQYGTLHYCGFQVLAPQISWDPAHTSQEARGNMLEAWRKRLHGLMEEKPLFFPSMDSFDKELGFQLRTELHEQEASKGSTVDKHLEKVPRASQFKSGV